MKKELICISCPVGCMITAEFPETAKLAESEITVTGNSCPRGIVYAKNELIAPKRIVTTTVRTDGNGVLPVKTANPVAKNKIFDILKELKNLEVKLPVSVGDVVFKNICGETDIVSTDNMI